MSFPNPLHAGCSQGMGAEPMGSGTRSPPNTLSTETQPKPLGLGARAGTGTASAPSAERVLTVTWETQATDTTRMGFPC